jgi:hypothetical protein
VRKPPAGALETSQPWGHIAAMADSEEMPVVEPFPDKEGTGWHVIIRYHAGHERRIEGFATKTEAVDWITANATHLDK